MGNPKIVIAGGSGFLGQSLLEKMRDKEIVVLTRGKARTCKNLSYVHWDGERAGDWVNVLEGSAAVINLVGRSVNCRYTKKNRQAIIHSRVHTTRLIGKAIQTLRSPPGVWINAGSAAIFGDGGDEVKNERSPVGEGFSAEVCKQWEAAFYGVDTPSTRKVSFRIGLVFQKGRGLLKPFSNLVRLGLGGKMGTGEQWISWIHEDDFTRLVLSAIERDDFRGVIHGTSPYPVKNKDFLKTLRELYHVRMAIPHPAYLLKIEAALAGTEAALLLSGRRVVSAVLEEKKFHFAYPRPEDALRHLISGNSPRASDAV